jgi:transcription elongation factor Elf1
MAVSHKDDEEVKIITMTCDHCKFSFDYKVMYYFQTNNPNIYNHYHHLCEECYIKCTQESTNL